VKWPCSDKEVGAAPSTALTIPPGSFKQVGGNLHFVLNATINGLQVKFNLKAANGSSSQFTYMVNIQGVDLTAQPDPMTVGLKVGRNTGATTVEFWKSSLERVSAGRQ
jgi:hypothetical protein